MGVFVNQQFAALETYAFTGFHDFFDVLDKEHGTSKLNVSEISGGVGVGKPICWADESGFKNPHTRVKQTSNNRFIVDVCVSLGNLGNRIAADFFRRQHTKLHADDTGRSGVLAFGGHVYWFGL